MPSQVIPFLMLNNEVAAEKLPSGTPYFARNVRIEGASLEGRPGFDVYEAGADANSAKALLSMAAVTFADTGDVYLVTKRSNGDVATLYYARVYNADEEVTVDIAEWTELVDPWSGHYLYDAGRFFTHWNRLFHVDRVGVTKWHPTTYYKPDSTHSATPAFSDGTAAKGWKGGMSSITGAIIAPATGGTKEGFYRAGVLKKNSVTDEISCIQDLQADSVETRASASYGGLTVTNWNNIRQNYGSEENDTADADYEFDRVVLLSSQGNTERRFAGDIPSYELREEMELLRTQGEDVGEHDEDPSMAKGDYILQVRPRHRNSSGLPPGAACFYWNGRHAVYARPFWSGTEQIGTIWHSLPGFPCTIPGDQTYGPTGGDTYTWRAEPWEGRIPACIAGTVMAVGHVGSSFVVWTKDGVYWLRESGDGRLSAIRSEASVACDSPTGAVSSPVGAYAIGAGGWHVASRSGVSNVARDAFTPLLDAIPEAYRDLTVLARYGYRNEIWAAVARQNHDASSVHVYDADLDAYSAIDGTHKGEGQTYYFQLLPDAPADGDTVNFILPTSSTPASITVAINRPAEYDEAAVMAWEAYGATGWESLTITKDGTNPDDNSGGRPFVDDGTITFEFSGTWTSTTINSETGYAVRAKFNTSKSDNMTRVPMLAPVGPSRILVFDEQRGGIVGWFEPRNLLGAAISCMTELNTPTERNKMLIGLDDGRILSYPASDYRDDLNPSATDWVAYGTDWYAWMGQEARKDALIFQNLTLRMNRNPVGVEVRVTGELTSQISTDTPTAWQTVTKANGLAGEGTRMVNLAGHLYRLQLRTPATKSGTSSRAGWRIDDLVATITRERIT